MSEVAEKIRQLHFVGRPVIRLYLNEGRVHDLFVGWVGAIDRWVATVSKTGRASAGPWNLITIGVEGTGANELSYDVSDPIAQTLILMSLVESVKRDDVAKAEAPDVTGYTVISGTTYLQRPDVHFPQEPAYTVDDQSRLGKLEDRRSSEERIHLAVGGGSRYWLATLMEGPDIKAASIMSDQYLEKSSVSSYVGTPWALFGKVQATVVGLPLVNPYAALAQP